MADINIIKNDTLVMSIVDYNRYYLYKYSEDEIDYDMINIVSFNTIDASPLSQLSDGDEITIQLDNYDLECIFKKNDMIKDDYIGSDRKNLTLWIIKS